VGRQNEIRTIVELRPYFVRPRSKYGAKSHKSVNGVFPVYGAFLQVGHLSWPLKVATRVRIPLGLQMLGLQKLVYESLVVSSPSGIERRVGNTPRVFQAATFSSHRH
jgi:hypothetical protein